MNHAVPRTSDSLIESTIRLMADHAQLPTVREIALEAGVSASLVNYRYGSVEALYEAALAESVQSESDLWIVRKSQYLTAPLQLSDLPGLLNELFLRDGWETQTVWAMRWMRIRRAYDDKKSVLPVVTQAEAAFWSSLGRMLNLDMRRQQILVAFYHGLAFGHLLAGREPGFQAWSSALVNCFFVRLLGVDLPFIGHDNAYRHALANHAEMTVLPLSEMHPTRRTILEAAADILVSEGVNALTHRRLAKGASASLSSVVHFFETRRIILKEAYDLLYQRLRLKALGQMPLTKDRAGNMTVAELVRALSPPNTEIARAREVELIGLLNAMFEASRDAETRAVALSLFARSGEVSRGLLAHIDHSGASIGWLDAQVFRLVSNGLVMISVSEAAALYDVDELSLSDILNVLFAEGRFGNDLRGL